MFETNRELQAEKCGGAGVFLQRVFLAASAN